MIKAVIGELDLAQALFGVAVVAALFGASAIALTRAERRARIALERDRDMHRAETSRIVETKRLEKNLITSHREEN